MLERIVKWFASFRVRFDAQLLKWQALAAERPRGKSNALWGD